MPGLDGFETAERISRDPKCGHPAIILLTSCGPEVRRGRRPPAILARLVKPVKQSELLDAVLNALGGRGVERQARAPRKPAARKRLRILLAEDNAVNQAMVVHILQRRGHAVMAAGNGRQAVELLGREEPFDAVLMDLEMPEMDGLEATAAIRAMEDDAARRVRIIAMTAHALGGDRERCLAAGMDGYVSKPVRPEELIRAVEGGEVPVEIAARFDGDRGLLRRLAAIFVKDCPKKMSDIKKAIEGKDPAALRQAAHALKGSVGLFGPGEAGELALQLEAMGLRADLTGAARVYRGLQSEVGRLKRTLSQVGEVQ
jgi:CheY-like chemotaxis protein